MASCPAVRGVVRGYNPHLQALPCERPMLRRRAANYCATGLLSVEHEDLVEDVVVKAGGVVVETHESVATRPSANIIASRRTSAGDTKVFHRRALTIENGGLQVLLPDCVWICAFRIL